MWQPCALGRLCVGCSQRSPSRMVGGFCRCRARFQGLSHWSGVLEPPVGQEAEGPSAMALSPKMLAVIQKVDAAEAEFFAALRASAERGAEHERVQKAARKMPPLSTKRLNVGGSPMLGTIPPPDPSAPAPIPPPPPPPLSAAPAPAKPKATKRSKSARLGPRESSRGKKRSTTRSKRSTKRRSRRSGR